MFSISDIQSGEGDNEFEEGEKEEGEEASSNDEPSYPIRASFSITKVGSHPSHMLYPASLTVGCVCGKDLRPGSVEH
jgi:hypothetical protein